MELQREFADLGYVHLRRLFSATEVAEIRREVEAYCRDVMPNLERRYKVLRYDDPAKICKLDCLDRHAPFFAQLLREPRLIEIAEQLLGGEVGGQFLHFQNSLPENGGEVMAHQDAFGPNFDPPRSINVWLSLGDYTERDGCLRYLRGSHLRGYQPALYGPLPNPHYDMTLEDCMETNEGDVLAHDSFTVHRSGLNSGTRDRWALIFGYFLKSAAQLSDDAWLAKYGGETQARAPLGRAYEAR